MARRGRKPKTVEASALDLNNDGVFDEKDKALAGKVLATKVDSGVVEKSPVDALFDSAEALIEAEGFVESSELGFVERLRLQCPDGLITRIDINPRFRKDDLVPWEQINDWASRGFILAQWFDEYKR